MITTDSRFDVKLSHLGTADFNQVKYIFKVFDEIASVVAKE